MNKKCPLSDLHEDMWFRKENTSFTEASYQLLLRVVRGQIRGTSEKVCGLITKKRQRLKRKKPP